MNRLNLTFCILFLVSFVSSLFAQEKVDDIMKSTFSEYSDVKQLSIENPLFKKQLVCLDSFKNLGHGGGTMHFGDIKSCSYCLGKKSTVGIFLVESSPEKNKYCSVKNNQMSCFELTSDMLKAFRGKPYVIELLPSKDIHHFVVPPVESKDLMSSITLYKSRGWRHDSYSLIGMKDSNVTYKIEIDHLNDLLDEKVEYKGKKETFKKILKDYLFRSDYNNGGVHSFKMDELNFIESFFATKTTITLNGSSSSVGDGNLKEEYRDLLRFLKKIEKKVLNKKLNRNPKIIASLKLVERVPRIKPATSIITNKVEEKLAQKILNNHLNKIMPKVKNAMSSYLRDMEKIYKYSKKDISQMKESSYDILRKNCEEFARSNSTFAHAYCNTIPLCGVTSKQNKRDNLKNSAIKGM